MVLRIVYTCYFNNESSRNFFADSPWRKSVLRLQQYRPNVLLSSAAERRWPVSGRRSPATSVIACHRAALYYISLCVRLYFTTAGFGVVVTACSDHITVRIGQHGCIYELATLLRDDGCPRRLYVVGLR